jgi:hypothetical protein
MEKVFSLQQDVSYETFSETHFAVLRGGCPITYKTIDRIDLNVDLVQSYGKVIDSFTI